MPGQQGAPCRFVWVPVCQFVLVAADSSWQMLAWLPSSVDSLQPDDNHDCPVAWLDRQQSQACLDLGPAGSLTANAAQPSLDGHLPCRACPPFQHQPRRDSGDFWVVRGS